MSETNPMQPPVQQMQESGGAGHQPILNLPAGMSQTEAHILARVQNVGEAPAPLTEEQAKEAYPGIITSADVPKPAEAVASPLAEAGPVTEKIAEKKTRFGRYLASLGIKR